MATRPRPYVGITGFMRKEEVRLLLGKISTTLFADRDLMVGALVSSKTMREETNRWPGRYPTMRELGRLFHSIGKRINIFHFNTDFPDQLAKDMIWLMEYVGDFNDRPECCHGFQLNVTWPDVRQIATFREKYPDARIILQLGSKALAEVNRDPGELYHKIGDYIGKNGPVTDVLYDPSGGEGVYSDINLSGPLLAAVEERSKYALGLGVAGGLRLERLHTLTNLIRRFPYLSVDAEGQLRSPAGDEHKHSNSLDLYKACAYLVGALTMFNPDAV